MIFALVKRTRRFLQYWIYNPLDLLLEKVQQWACARDGHCEECRTGGSVGVKFYYCCRCNARAFDGKGNYSSLIGEGYYVGPATVRRLQ